MALWTFLKDGVGYAWTDEAGDTVSSWDDGLTLNPDEPGFRRDLAEAKAGELGQGVGPAYAGTPTWRPPAPESEG